MFLFRLFRDSYKSLGCVVFDISGSIFLEYELYGVVLKIIVLFKESVCLFFK